jgi:hypothetical protein
VDKGSIFLKDSLNNANFTQNDVRDIESFAANFTRQKFRIMENQNHGLRDKDNYGGEAGFRTEGDTSPTLNNITMSASPDPNDGSFHPGHLDPEYGDVDETHLADEGADQWEPTEDIDFEEIDEE